MVVTETVGVEVETHGFDGRRLFRRYFIFISVWFRISDYICDSLHTGIGMGWQGFSYSR
jgi:hypothetical protein